MVDTVHEPSQKLSRYFLLHRLLRRVSVVQPPRGGVYDLLAQLLPPAGIDQILSVNTAIEAIIFILFLLFVLDATTPIHLGSHHQCQQHHLPI